jgi:hypothetical protein
MVLFLTESNNEQNYSNVWPQSRIIFSSFVSCCKKEFILSLALMFLLFVHLWRICFFPPSLWSNLTAVQWVSNCSMQCGSCVCKSICDFSVSFSAGIIELLYLLWNHRPRSINVINFELCVNRWKKVSLYKLSVHMCSNVFMISV